MGLPRFDGQVGCVGQAAWGGVVVDEVLKPAPKPNPSSTVAPDDGSTVPSSCSPPAPPRAIPFVTATRAAPAQQPSLAITAAREIASPGRPSPLTCPRSARS